LYWENPDRDEYISIIPTSGITGEGIPDILGVIIKDTTTYM
jgi:translation initiation factor 5B